MNYMCIPGLLCAGSALLSASAAEKTDSRPNILVFLIDDAGYNDFGFMGSEDMKTPNIDALSEAGTILTDAHVAATVSSPSRACLITGRYGHRFGYECNLPDQSNGLPATEKTLGDIFKSNGYRTAAIGKWHLGNQDFQHPNQKGFDLFYGMISGHREYFYNEKGSDRPGNDQHLQLNGRQVRFDGYLTDEFSDKAVEFIKEDDQPFMLYLAYNAVHNPMQAPEEDLARFKGEPRQKLAAMTYALDRGIGKVVNALKESGKYSNTLIFFLSDNGGAMTNTSSNYPLKGYKGNKFEGGHRVPFFVVWDGHVPAGKEYHGLSSSLDIMATALDAAGIRKTPSEIDGVSLLNYLSGKKKSEPHEMLFWRKMATRAIRCGDYKLIITEGVDSVLYNIEKDPEEMKNLLPQEPAIYKDLSGKLRAWEKNECIDPLWVERGNGKNTNRYHELLMHNQIKEAKDLKNLKNK